MRFPALLVLLVLASCGASQPPPPEEAPKPVTTEEQRTAVAGVVEQYRQAYEVASMDALASLYAQDLDVVLVYEGASYSGWSAVQAFLEKKLAGASSVRMAMKDVSIRGLGPDAAVVTATRESSIGDGSVTLTEKGVLTLVLEKQQGRWMVVAEHFSYPVGRS